MRYLFFFTLFFVSFGIKAQIESEKEIMKRMMSASEKMRSAKFTMHSEERLTNGKFEIADRIIKFQKFPKQVYIYAIKPNVGTEVLWKEGWNEEKLLISPGSFPFITFSTKINSSIARNNSHHPITNVGFNYLMGIVDFYITSLGDKFYNNFTIEDTVQWDNHSCILVKFDNKDYKEVFYTVKKNENITDIAAKHRLNDYSILIMNPSIKDFDDVKEGQVIRIPNFYSKSLEFYIDRATWLPLKQTLTDKNGAYERYEMKSFILNPVFKSDEFSSDYKDYSF